MATLYPIELNVSGEPIAVIGGGKVATRKVRGLVEAGARVRVISPAFTSELLDRDDIERIPESYQEKWLKPARLVFACTDDTGLNARIAADARKLGIWCNIADDAAGSDFVLPAILRRGFLTVAIGTGGTAPRLSVRLRDQLASQLGPEFAILVEEWARARRTLQDRIGDPDTRRAALDALGEAYTPEALQQRDREALRDRFERIIRKWTTSSDRERDAQ